MNTELKNKLMELGKQVGKSVGLFILGILLGCDISQAFFIACVPYGWKILNMITPNVFLWMPFIGWVIYFVVKVTLAAVIGIFVMAYTWIKCIAKVVMTYRNTSSRNMQE